MKIKGIIAGMAIISLLSMSCDFSKSRAPSHPMEGFTAEDMDKGQNNNPNVYPHVGNVKIEPLALSQESPWVFYITFDKEMDTSLTPDITLQEVINYNETATRNYVDTSSIKWVEKEVLTFKTTLDFKPYDILDRAFNPDADSWVSSVAVQPDGKILIGGSFTRVGVTGRNRIARLNPDGSLDTFNPDANDDVRTIAVQPDGKILIGGAFTSVSGTGRNRIARLNPDGSLDTFNPDANNVVWTIAVQPDGKILIGGSFTRVGGTLINYIARLNSDGSLDPTFVPDPNGTVYSVAVQPDGKILIGGSFTRVGVTGRNRIARLNSNGSLDDTFNPDADNSVRSIAVQPDGKILIGGDFRNVSGTGRNRIARLNPNGSLDDTFNPDADNSVRSIAVQPDGKILIGGVFTRVNGMRRNHIARLNPDGTLDTTFDPDADFTVSSIAVQSDGKILIGGAFTNVSGTPRNHIARLKPYCAEGPRFCDNYLLTIESEKTKSILGIELDGNYQNLDDDYINAPSDYFQLLSELNPPSPFPAGFVYDLTPASVNSNEAGDYLKPDLSDASVQERIHIGFDYAMNKEEITNSTIEIFGPDGKKLEGSWWVDTNGDGNPDQGVESAPNTATGQTNTYYRNFWFRPEHIPLPLGRYTIVVHCDSIHKVPITDPANGVFQRVLTCNDFEDDGMDNNVILEFYVTENGEAPPVTNIVWAVYTSSSPGPFGGEIKENQAFVLFQTPDPMDNIMDASTLIPQNLKLEVRRTPLGVTTSVQTRILKCAPSTVWVITAGNEDLNWGATLTINYSVRDEEGNTLDGNLDGIYELSRNDNFYRSIPYLYSWSGPYEPPNYIQVQDIYTQGRNPKNYLLGSDEIIIAFSTPAVNDDRLDVSSLSDDDLILEGGPDRPNCTCTCTPNCAGAVMMTTFEDSQNFNGIPTTLWKVKFTNPASCNVKDCRLTIQGGSRTADNNRPQDICGNWLYPDYIAERLP